MFLVLAGPSAGVTQELSRQDSIAKTLEVFYLLPSQLSPYDRIDLKGNTASIQVWRQLPPDPNPQLIECQGYQWLLAGRGQKIGAGAKQVFENFADLQSLELSWVDIEFASKSNGGRGMMAKEEKAKTYAKFKITRDKALSINLDPKSLKNALQKSTEDCLKMGRKWISEKEVKW